MFSSDKWFGSTTGFYPETIDQSLRFEDGDTANLSKTPSSVGNRKTFTWSAWVKRGNIGSTQTMFASAVDGNNASWIRFTSGNAIEYVNVDSASTTDSLITSRLFRDTINWYHIVLVVDTTKGTDTDRIKIYINGTQETSFSTSNYPIQNYDTDFSNTCNHQLGARNSTVQPFDGYMAEVNFIDGQALTPSAFGETKNSVWIPNTYENKISEISRTDGTAIGDLTGQSGLSASFDGTLFKAYASSSATTGSQTTGYIGKDWGSGTTHTVTGFAISSTTNFGFVGSGATTFTVKLYGSNSTPSNSTDGTLLFTSSSVTDANSRGTLKYFSDTTINSEEAISSFTTTTAFRYHWVVITPNTSESIFVSQVQFYEVGTSNYYGTNGFRFTFADSSNLGDDTSGLSTPNDFASSGLASTDVVPDSPTNNFATFNNLYRDVDSTPTLSEGNLRADGTSSSWFNSLSTFTQSSGKWYAEFDVTNYGTGSFIAIATAPSTSTYLGSDTNAYGYHSSGNIFHNNSASAYGDSWTGGGIIGVALDLDGGNVYFYKDGVIQNSGTPAVTGLTGEWTIGVSISGSTGEIRANFGQDATFQGDKTSGSDDASDSNGQGTFYETPPTSYLALCSSNLSDNTLSPNKSEQADDYFNTITYDGNGGTNAITGVGFQPDWVWSKRRNASGSNNIWDSVRGATKLLFTDAPQIVEKTVSGLTSFDPDGFTMGSEVTFSNNINLSNYVAWNWRAGGSASSNTDGGISSSVSVSKEAGFSIVTYTGTGSASTVGHGLDFAPTFIMVFSRDVANSTVVGSTAINGWTHYISLANSGFSVSDSSIWNNTAPTTEVFSVGTADNTNKSTNTFVAYCFHDIEGYSKFNKFTGGGTFFPYVHLGFRPAYVMIKRTSASGGWTVFDDTRNTGNSTDLYLGWDGSFEEKDGSTLSPAINIDFLSNGFKVRSTENVVNSSGGTFLYFAFARQPFKFSNAR